MIAVASAGVHAIVRVTIQSVSVCAELAVRSCSCSSSTDCFGGGDCVSGGCRCDATWTGPHCKHLHLLPVEARRPGFPVNGPGPTNPSLPTDSSFTWGGAMAEEGGLYHLFFTEWVNHCPMTFNTFYTSTHIAHVTSPTSLGPWTRAGVAVPPPRGPPPS